MAASSQESKVNIPTVLNTSNKGKKVEFERLFKHYGLKNLSFSMDDLKEIDSTPIDVVVHKASTVNEGKGGVIVEDTSLDVDGKEVGINVRWLLNSLKNKKPGDLELLAVWRVCLAFKLNDKYRYCQRENSSRPRHGWFWF